MLFKGHKLSVMIQVSSGDLMCSMAIIAHPTVLDARQLLKE